MRCIALAVQDDGEDVPDGRFAARVLLSSEELGGARPSDGLHGVQATPLAAPCWQRNCRTPIPPRCGLIASELVPNA